MAQRIRVKSIKRKQLDEDKLAFAFLLLAKILDEAERADSKRGAQTPDTESL